MLPTTEAAVQREAVFPSDLPRKINRFQLRV
jgi:hypothetical protein